MIGGEQQFEMVEDVCRRPLRLYMATSPRPSPARSKDTRVHYQIIYSCKHADRIHVTFIDKEGTEHTFEVAKGDNLLDIAQANDLEMEGISILHRPHHT